MAEKKKWKWPKFGPKKANKGADDDPEQSNPVTSEESEPSQTNRSEIMVEKKWKWPKFGPKKANKGADDDPEQSNPVTSEESEPSQTNADRDLSQNQKGSQEGRKEIVPDQTKADDMSTRMVQVTIGQGQVFCQVDSFNAKLNIDGLKTSKEIKLLMKPEVTTCVMGKASCSLPGNAFSGKDPFTFQLQKGSSLVPFNKGKDTTSIRQGKASFHLEDKSSVVTSAKKIKAKILGEKLIVKVDNVKIKMTSDHILIKDGKKEILNCTSKKSEAFKLITHLTISPLAKGTSSEIKVTLANA